MMTEKWKCVRCGGTNPPNREACIGCGTPRLSEEEQAEAWSRGFNELLAEAKGKPKWEYLVGVYQLERKGILGTSFSGSWAHPVLNPSREKSSVDEELAILGQLGWELVSVMPNSSPTTSSYSGETSEWIYYLKRPLG